MRAPSLRNRVVVLGVIVVAIVVATINGFLYLAFRTALLHNLDDVLRERSRVVLAEASTRSGQDLAARLTELGLRATVLAPDGAVYGAEPPSPFMGRNLPRRDSRPVAPAISRDVSLPDGSTVTVFANRTGVDDATRKLLLLEAGGLVMATLLAAVLLRQTSGLALRPLKEIAASARRTSAGQRGERGFARTGSTALSDSWPAPTTTCSIASRQR